MDFSNWDPPAFLVAQLKLEHWTGSLREQFSFMQTPEGTYCGNLCAYESNSQRGPFEKVGPWPSSPLPHLPMGETAQGKNEGRFGRVSNDSMTYFFHRSVSFSDSPSWILFSVSASLIRARNSMNKELKRESLFKPISLCAWEVLRLGQHISVLFTSLTVDRRARDWANSSCWPQQWPLLSRLQRLLFNILAYNNSFVYQVFFCWTFIIILQHIWKKERKKSHARVWWEATVPYQGL